MLTTNKIKWLGTLTIAGVLLVLALLGGNWGTTYAADTGALQAPEINYIAPDSVKVGTSYIIMIIGGANFGDDVDTRVRLSGSYYDEMLKPIQVLPDGISVLVRDYFLAQQDLYIVTVVKSTSHTVPTIPTIDPIDLVSNKVNFVVYEPYFLPVINKNK